jgi:hypothetical protein
VLGTGPSKKTSSQKAEKDYLEQIRDVNMNTGLKQLCLGTIILFFINH